MTICETVNNSSLAMLSVCYFISIGVSFQVTYRGEAVFELIVTDLDSASFVEILKQLKQLGVIP